MRGYIEAFNEVSEPIAKKLLLDCLGSKRWVQEMIEQRPFSNLERLFQAAERIWNQLSKEDWLEAFSSHPRIGDRKVQDKTAQREQSGVQAASEEILLALAAGNREYERKHKFIFLICASGKSARELLNILQRRIQNDTETEMEIAMEEQAKITRLRLERMFL